VFDLVPIADAPADAVEALLDAAFGADRHTRTAYRVREGTAPIPELSFAALEQGALVGSIQCWPVALACDDGGHVPLVMVGPVAVSPDRQNVGIGRALMWKSIRVAEGGGVPGGDALMLVGDPEYYAQFGFDAAATGHWRLPGPFEARRLLARGGDVPDRAGTVVPRPPFTGAIKSA
jgi:predicted N-acetyltransferase YhbS